MPSGSRTVSVALSWADWQQINANLISKAESLGKASLYLSRTGNFDLAHWYVLALRRLPMLICLLMLKADWNRARILYSYDRPTYGYSSIQAYSYWVVPWAAALILEWQLPTSPTNLDLASTSITIGLCLAITGRPFSVRCTASER